MTILLSVFAVSVDALCVGPAQGSVMLRYTAWQIVVSFAFMGLMVSVLVYASGLLALIVKDRIKKKKPISPKRFARKILIGYMAPPLFICGIVVFTVASGMYDAGMSSSVVLWFLSIMAGVGVFGLFLAFPRGNCRDIWELSRSQAKQSG